MAGIKHKWTSPAADGSDSTKLQPSKWNEDHGTAETNTSLVLAPDGTGGVEFRAEAGGLENPMTTDGDMIFLSDPYSVGGAITLILKDVPWDQALDIILQQKGLDMRKNGNVILIAPREEIATKEKLEVILHADYSVDDGRYANNGWLQEFPDPITKITWDNAVLVSPQTAQLRLPLIFCPSRFMNWLAGTS